MIEIIMMTMIMLNNDMIMIILATELIITPI